MIIFLLAWCPVGKHHSFRGLFEFPKEVFKSQFPIPQGFFFFFPSENMQKVIHDSFIKSSMFSQQIPREALELMLPFLLRFP